VHLCLGCGKISRNRIAGDDNSNAIVGLLNVNSKPDKLSMDLLTEKDRPEVMTALFGHDNRK
jgi:hypothetical protein